MQQTSLDAFSSINKELGQRQIIVYNKLKEMTEATNAMLSRSLGWPINCITPRVYELRQKGLVKESYRDTCPITGRTAIFWRVK